MTLEGEISAMRDDLKGIKAALKFLIQEKCDIEEEGRRIQVGAHLFRSPAERDQALERVSFEVHLEYAELLNGLS